MYFITDKSFILLFWYEAQLTMTFCLDITKNKTIIHMQSNILKLYFFLLKKFPDDDQTRRVFCMLVLNLTGVQPLKGSDHRKSGKWQAEF